LCCLSLLVESSLKIFDRLEELREISLSESSAAGSLLHLGLGDGVEVASDALDDLDEDGGSVSEGLGEDLHQDAHVVLVDEEAELLARVDEVLRQGVGANARRGSLVVAVVGLGHELKAADQAALAHLLHGGQDVVGLEREVLQAGPAVLLEVRLDLGLPLGAEGGLVQGHEDLLVVAR
jgi:hypothetical protein